MKITLVQQKLMRDMDLKPEHLLIMQIIYAYQQSNNGAAMSKYGLRAEFLRRRDELQNVEYEA
jgi:hypothetical protein